MTDNCSGTTTLVSSSQRSRPLRQRNQRKGCVGIAFFPLTSIRVSQTVPPAIQVFDNSRSQRQLWHPLRRHRPAIPRDVKAARTPPPVQAIPDQQGALGDVRQCRRRPGQFARSGIGVEVQMARHAAVQVIEGRHTAGQDTRAHLPQEAPPMGDRIEARPVDDPDLREALTQGVQRAA